MQTVSEWQYREEGSGSGRSASASSGEAFASNVSNMLAPRIAKGIDVPTGVEAASAVSAWRVSLRQVTFDLQDVRLRDVEVGLALLTFF